jgi:type VI secretion system secreted protein VgrG
MASPYTQDQRIGRLKIDALRDLKHELVLASIEGIEGLSQLFEYRVEAFSLEKKIINFDKAIAEHCTVFLKTVDGGERIFDGMLAEARWIGTRVEGHAYELILRPWLWLLSKRINSLIFHEKTAPEIIKLIFDEHGGPVNFLQSLTKSYPTLEYCAQYRESDMDFVCRLMEEHGISYHFRHSEGNHKLVMGDSESAYQNVSGTSRPFVSVAEQHNRDTEHLSLWRPERKYVTGNVAMVDYDFKKPSANMKAEKSGDNKFEQGKFESYIHPGRYVNPSEGLLYAEAQLHMRRGEDCHFHAEGDCATLYPGSLVNLTGHPDDDQNQQYLVLKASHRFEGQSYRSGGGGAQVYRGSYEFIRADQPFSPPMTTPKPYIRGPQTAKVVGGGEIDCDEYGRIQVRFHWDRKSDKSRWVRVAQVAAGQKWGAVFTPRVGMEVIVDFLEGDPDQPIIIGCVYNQENMPPFDLPGKKNISGWKTNSTTGGGGYNELVMDDSKGSELVRFHGQKDLDSTIENDEKRLIKNDRKTQINHNDTLNVTNEIAITANSKITITCGKSTITMDPMSIKIESPNVEINTELQFKSNSKLLSQHEAKATMIINGTIVKIN